MEEFQDGFANALQQYLTIRTKQKRKLVQNAFRDFAKSIDKPNFQIERYTDTIQKISPSSIALLGFIKGIILPYREAAIHKQLSANNLGTEKPYDCWFKLTLKRESMSKYIGEWIHEQFDPTNESIKEKYGEGPSHNISERKQIELAEAEQNQLEKYNAPIHELIYLGFCATATDSQVVWGGNAGTTWSLTTFGYEFLGYIEDESKQNRQTVIELN